MTAQEIIKSAKATSNNVRDRAMELIEYYHPKNKELKQAVLNKLKKVVK